MIDAVSSISTLLAPTPPAAVSLLQNIDNYDIWLVFLQMIDI